LSGAEDHGKSGARGSSGGVENAVYSVFERSDFRFA
jgi:hypothetical protein